MRIKLHHVNLCSTDVPALEAFYRGVLDLAPEPSLAEGRIRDKDGYPGDVAFVTDGTTQFHLSEKDLGINFRTGQAINPVERGHIAFRTDDIAAFKQRLADKGISYSDFGAWAMKGWEQIFFYDPDGTIIEVHQVQAAGGKERKPALGASQVEEMVRKAHSDLARVEALLAEAPALANACWDWGGGDFESALGAAAHVGRKDIANALLAKGARLDIFAAAMLGKLEVVKAALAAFPAAIDTPGPHGIPLIAHAKMGGAEAEPVLDYLQALQAGR